jgi:formylglycine-generating enzyme required for sulfatase activity
MRLVPAGEFTMGSDADDALAECQKYLPDDCQRDWFTDEEPAHQVYLDAFYMDTYEVTNARYKACVDAGKKPDREARAVGAGERRIAYCTPEKEPNHKLVPGQLDGPLVPPTRAAEQK